MEGLGRPSTRRVVRRGVVFAIATVVAIAAGCSSSSSSQAGANATTTSTVAPTSAPSTVKASIASTLKPGDKYVALGSSYASGFGIPVQSTKCGRSSRDYGALIASEFHLAYTDVSCGGAVIADILNRSQLGYPPQIEAVTKDTKLVSVTVGGNDIAYAGTAIGCGDPANKCVEPATLTTDLVKTHDALQRMVSALHAAAPAAVLVFVTYPRMVPDGNCPALGFTDADAAILRDMGAKLEQVFVDTFKNTNVVFVDPYAAPGDHTACAAPSERWEAGHVAPGGFPYHPTALGHQVMAQMIAAALQKQ